MILSTSEFLCASAFVPPLGDQYRAQVSLSTTFWGCMLLTARETNENKNGFEIRRCDFKSTLLGCVTNNITSLNPHLPHGIDTIKKITYFAVLSENHIR